MDFIASINCQVFGALPRGIGYAALPRVQYPIFPVAKSVFFWLMALPEHVGVVAGVDEVMPPRPPALATGWRSA